MQATGASRAEGVTCGGGPIASRERAGQHVLIAALWSASEAAHLKAGASDGMVCTIGGAALVRGAGEGREGHAHSSLAVVRGRLRLSGSER